MTHSILEDFEPDLPPDCYSRPEIDDMINEIAPAPYVHETRFRTVQMGGYRIGTGPSPHRR